MIWGTDNARTGEGRFRAPSPVRLPDLDVAAYQRAFRHVATGCLDLESVGGGGGRRSRLATVVYVNLVRNRVAVLIGVPLELRVLSAGCAGASGTRLAYGERRHGSRFDLHVGVVIVVFEIAPARAARHG